MDKTIKKLLISIPMIFFLGCGDNTDTPPIKDIKSIQIDDGNISIYSTDQSKTLNASVTYTDNTTETITNSDMWANSNYDVLSMSGSVITPVKNGGSATISIQIGGLKDEIDVDVIKIVDFNILHGNISTTGDYAVEAIGEFENNQEKKVYENIVWSVDENSSSSISTDENYVTTLNIQTGDTNLTATVFGEDSDTNITKSVLFSID